MCNFRDVSPAHVALDEIEDSSASASVSANMRAVAVHAVLCSSLA